MSDVDEQTSDGSSSGTTQAVVTVDDHLSRGDDKDDAKQSSTNGAAQQSSQSLQQPLQSSAQHAASALSPDIVAQLAEARLKPVANEDDAAALRRLNRHYSGLSRKHYNEVKSMREDITQTRAMAENLARAEWQRIQAAQRERQMATLPDPSVDREAYNTALLEELARKQLEAERFQSEQQAEEQRLSAVLDVDEAAFNDVEREVTTDPEAAAAYQFATENGFRYVEALYPDAPQEKVAELVQLVQQNEIRMHHLRGLSYLDTAKAAMNNAFAFAQRYGYAPQPQQAQVAPQQQVQQQAPQQSSKGNKGGSSNADRLRAQHAKSQAQQVVSPGGRPGSAPNGNGIDLRAPMSEEDYVKARVTGAIKDSDYDELVKNQFGVDRLGRQ